MTVSVFLAGEVNERRNVLGQDEEDLALLLYITALESFITEGETVKCFEKEFQLCHFVKYFQQGEQSMDYDEANKIVSEFDLEGTLLQKGVSPEHIAYLREKNPKDLNEYYIYFDHISKNDKKNTLVETQKIIGISRANKKASFYDNAEGGCGSELNVYRMATAIEHITNDALEQLYNWYENLYDPVALIYFSDEDVYKVGRDGNHRSLYAYIVGAPLIKAEVHYYKRNEEKYRTFLFYKKICSDYAVVSVDRNFYDTKLFSAIKIGNTLYLATLTTKKMGNIVWNRLLS